MNGTATRFLRLGGGLSGLLVLGWVLASIGQAAQPANEGLPTDWSHRHLIFSRPATFEKVRQITSDPRYWQQWYRQNVTRVLFDPAGEDHDTSINLGSFAADNHAAASRKVHRDWSEDLGNGASVGAGNYPAKYSFQITSANCGSAATPDYVVYSTGLNGSTAQASVVGYDNLYSGCTGTKPTVYWAYNTGGQILTSPVISTGGSQVAFVQTAGSEGTLVLLKWAAASGTVSSPVTLTAVATSAYRTCTAPCMTTILLRDGFSVPTDDTTSSVYPDYTHDVLWVGGALGWLHKITGAFRGTPAEATTGGFPVQTNVGNPTGNSLSSPVHDQISDSVFVGDAGGFFYRVSSTGVVTKSGQIDFGAGLVAGPIVDPTAEKIYVFSSSDGSTSCGGAPCSAVFQFTPTFASASKGSEAIVGNSQIAPPNPNPLYEGSFDSTYQASANATGNLYVCGNTAGIPTLYQVPIAAGVFGTVLPGPALASATTGCSPVTDIPNPNAVGGTAEWIFASSQANGLGTSCAGGGCIVNFNVQPWQPNTSYAIGQVILDSKLNVQVVRTAGTSRTVAMGHPNWNPNINGTTTDGTGTTAVRWTCQGPHLASHPAWQANHAYSVGQEIVDSNGNVEWVLNTTGTGISRATQPVWNTVISGPTNDNMVHWRMVGAISTANLAASGGTSGIIMDNTVAGDSEVYYSTQGAQICATSGGTGGCAVQASQSALQ